MGLGNWIMIIILFILIGGMVLCLYNAYSFSNNNCLKQKATDYCNSIEQSYDSLNWDIGSSTFYCKISERNTDGIEYSFTKQELRECWR